jgi:UDP-glucose 4-epimerase
VFNVGGSEPISHQQLVALLIDVAGGGTARHVPWPAEKKAIDIGSSYCDSTRIRDAVGWTPRVGLRAGFARTIEYYRAHVSQYLDDPAPTPSTVA